jgi:hypothetical protein
MAKREQPVGMLLNDEQRGIIEKFVKCRICAGTVSTFNPMGETLIQCNACRELYVATIFEPDMLWLALANAEKSRRYGRHIYWKGEADVWTPKRPARRRAENRPDSSNNRGIAAKSLEKARALHERIKEQEEAAAWEQSRAEIKSALDAQGCFVTEIRLAMIRDGFIFVHTFHNYVTSRSTTDHMAGLIVDYLKVCEAQIVGMSLVHECEFVKVSILPKWAEILARTPLL